MPSSSSARMMRTAISPRLATRTFENTARSLLPAAAARRALRKGVGIERLFAPAPRRHRRVEAKLDGVDEGLPIAYLLLERNVPVYASGGEQVGTVDHVVAAPEQDIFHGIVMTAGNDRRFVAADQIAAL